MSYYFSGTLHEDDPTYVKRQADNELFEALRAGEFCYVLSSRQTGKSSLRVRTMSRLKQAGLACSVIDVSADATNEVEPKQWYANLVSTLTYEFDLDFQVGHWYRQQDWFSPLSRFREFLESILLAQIRENIVIFIDEIDSLLSLPFPTDDFFALIRACHNKRVDNPIYKRLTFCLLGVATPSDLIRDKKRTPFNIGKGIELTRFTFEEAQGSLTPGLAQKVDNPERILSQVLGWTGGQPFLTQKVCQLVIDNANSRQPDIERLVQTHVIDHWENQDIPEHLGTIRDRLLADERIASRKLGLYEAILHDGSISADMSEEKMQLRLSGVVAKVDEKLVPYNLIYKTIFDRRWIGEKLAELRPDEYASAFNAWISSERNDSQLLRGEAMEIALRWKEGRSLCAQDQDFIVRSQELDRQDKQKANLILEAANRTARQRILLGSVVLGIASVAAVAATLQAGHALRQLNETDKRLRESNEKLQLAEGKVQQKEAEAQDAQARAEAANEQLAETQVSLSQTTQDLELSQSNLTQTNQQLASTQTQLTNTEQQRQQAEVARQQAEQGLETAEDARQKAEQELATTEDALQQTNQELNQALEQTAQANTSRDEAVQQAEQADREKQQAQQQTRIAQQERQAAEQQREEAVVATRLERTGNRVLRLFESGQEIKALLLAMQSGVELQSRVDRNLPIHEYTSITPLFALQRILDRIHERNTLNANGDIQFSSNQQFIAKPMDDGTVSLWNVSGQHLAHFEGEAVTFSPDSQHLATQSRNGTIRIWNLTSKQKIAEIQALFSKSLQFSPDGQKIAALLHETASSSTQDSMTRTIGLWNLAGEKIKEFPSSSTQIEFSSNGNYLALGNDVFRLDNLSKCHQVQNRAQLSFSPDGKSITTYHQDNHSIELWNSSCQRIQQFNGTKAQFSPNSQYLVTSNRNPDRTYQIALWTFSGKKLIEIKGGLLENIVKFTSDGKYFSLMSENNSGVEVWQISEEEVSKTTLSEKLRGRNITSVKFSPDGKYLTTKKESYFTIWDLSEQRKIKEIEGDYLSFSENSQYIIIQKEGKIKLFDTSVNQVEELKGNTLTFSNLKIINHDARFVTSYHVGKARFWDISGNHLLELKSNELTRINSFLFFSFSPNGNHILTLSNASTNGRRSQKKLHVWDKFGNLTLERDVSPRSQATFSPDNQHIIIQSNRQISILNLSGQKLKEFETEGKHIQVAPDSPYLVAISDAYPQVENPPSVPKVQKWNLSGQLLKESTIQLTNRDSSEFLQSVEISPDARHFAASLGDDKIGLWDVSGRQLKEFEGFDVKFSPDGQYLMTSSHLSEKTETERFRIRVYHLSGQVLKEFNSHTSLINQNHIHLSSNGRYLVFLINSEKIAIWDFETQKLTEFQGEGGSFSSLQISPNGKYIMTRTCFVVTNTSNCNREIQLWDLSGRKLADFTSTQILDARSQNTAVFSPDEKLLAITLGDRVKLWRISGLDELLMRGCDWLEYYFATYPEDRQGVCPNKSS